jgi:sugar phosphate isomerase/epimerase
MQDLPSYRFGVSEFTTWPWTFEEDIERYARFGVEAIEICEFKLDQERIGEQLALIHGANLEITGVQPVVRTLFPSQSQPEPELVPDRMRRFRRTIEHFGPLAHGVPFVTNTGIPPNGNIHEALDTAAREYRELADFAAGHGARVALEPLNASIMNVESSIWTLDQAMEVVEAVDRSNFGICLDLWNVWQNAGIIEAIKACGDRIFAVEVSDWRTPRSYQDRLIPGQGLIPMPALLRAIHQSGYRGAYVVEIFSGDVADSLWERDLEQVIADSRNGLDGAWQQAFASAPDPQHHS